MSLLVTHRHTFFIGVFGLFVSLLLHDWNLYPSLRPYGTLMFSVLQLLLLGIPFVSGSLLVRTPRITGIKRLVIWVIWFFFLPFTIYLMTEIRHATETWVLYPAFLYALAGVLMFVFSLSQVSTKLIPHSSKKRIFILGVCLYASIVSMFLLQSVATVFSKPSFYINVSVYFVFTSILFFVLNRILYRAHRHIF